MRVDTPPMNESPSKKSSTPTPSSPCGSSLRQWNRWKSLLTNREMNTTSKPSFYNQVRLKEAIYHLKSASQSKVYGATEECRTVSDEVANSNSTIPPNSNSSVPRQELTEVTLTLSIELHNQTTSRPTRTCYARVSRPSVSQKQPSSLAT